MIRPVSNVQLVKHLYCEMNGQHSIIPLTVTHDALNLLLRPCPSIASVIYKCSSICLIGYLDFISCEWFLIAWGQTHKHAL